jgi:hypothetical protein
MGTVGPSVLVNELADSEVDGPLIFQLGNGDLQADWAGTAFDADYPGFSIGAATGAALGFIFLGPTPEDSLIALIGGVIVWSGEIFFDDEVNWVYRRSATFRCVPCGNGNDGTVTYEPMLLKNGLVESYSDNDWFDFYPKHDPVPTE